MSGSIPKDRTHNEVVDFDAAHLPPGPEGIPRAGSTAFPGAIDSWPDHQDIEDEKVFAKYNHDLYCAVIAIERLLKQSIIETGAVHQHFQFITTYEGNPEIIITDIPDTPGGPRFLTGTVFVARRGRVLELVSEWTEGLDLRSIYLQGTHSDLVSIGDTITIGYAMPLSL
ncbi:MAG: hypothetical protein A2Y38_04245 [Spirochaetes bacterium GWB1_59_5]|nr:MAG: hypothetical protein A2Y38_04245 [Spirochaetes bacterium GWB1_59_5]